LDLSPLRAAHCHHHAESARSSAPVTRTRPSRLKLSGARLLPPGAVPAVAAARVRALAHVHRVRRRRRYATARRRRTVRQMAARDDETMKRDVAERRHEETSRRTVAVKGRAAGVGVEAVGVASLERSAHGDELDQWLAAGYAGTMTYLPRQADKRKHPARIMPDARVAVVTLTNYFHGSTDPGRKPGAPGNPRPAPGVSAPASRGRIG